jgi:hypothetical protein
MRLPRWRGAVDIASATETQDPGSNPAIFWGKNIAMLLCIFDLCNTYVCIVCVLKKGNEGIGPQKVFLKFVSFVYNNTDA